MAADISFGKLAIDVDLRAQIASNARLASPATGPFELRAGPLGSGELDVRSLRGTEALSKCFRFDVECTSDVDPQWLRPAVLGQAATLVMHTGEGAPRLVHGVTSALRERGPVRYDDHRQAYTLRLVPKLWLLRKRRNSRIFQDLTVVDVVGQVLKAAGVAHRWNLQRRYPVRSYSVQYQESDYDFVTRLLAEAGIYFFFEPPSGLAESLLGGIGGAIAAGAGALGSLVGGAVGRAASELADAAGLTETVVFADTAQGYVPIDDGTACGSVLDAVSARASAAFGTAGASLGGDLGAFAGAAMGAVASRPSPELHFFDGDGNATGNDDYVMAFVLEREIKSKSVTLRDYDFKRPLLDLTASASMPLVGASGAASLDLAGSVGASASASLAGGFAAAAGALLGQLRVEADVGAAIAPGRMEVYEHHGEYEESDAFLCGAQTRLEQLRANALRGVGESACRRLAPGYRFTLDDHPRDGFNREYAVTEVEHLGDAGAHDEAGGAGLVYQNRFVCVPSAVVARPPAPRRTVQQVVEIAHVVGPAGEEIHTDQFGRIKVQFPWDREGQRDDHSSCWMRVSQAWAGAGWGSQIIPRIGMEVMVTFLGGDVDRPVVTGCLYNELNPTPFWLPEHKTRSGLRTSSTPGGVGFNELSFEDSAGAEQVYLHAQRDLDEVVGHDHTLRVANNEQIAIGVDATHTVGRHRTDVVQGDHAETVAGNQSRRVDGDRMDVVSGRLDARVEGDVVARVGGTERRAVTGAVEHTLAHDWTIRVAGCATTLVGRHDAPRSYLVHAEGTAQLSGALSAELSSEKEIVLRCGKSSIRLTPDGIELSGPAVHVAGGGAGLSVADDKLKLRATGAASFVAEKLTFKSAAASVGLFREVKIDGSQILLNSPESATDPVSEDTPEVTKIELRDRAGKPLAYQRYRILLEDGSQRSGILDKDGKAEVEVAGAGKIVFPDLPEAAKS